MNLEIPQFIKTDSLNFINFWKNEYSYFSEELYDDNIGKTLNEYSIMSLYKWKNGNTEISQKKLYSIKKIYFEEAKRLPEINNLKAGEEYLKKLEGGAIWNIFWLHCLKPDLFPIFDQHTYRSMIKIKSGSPSEISTCRTKKIEIYFNDYIPFIKNFEPLSLTQREIDKALFAYGRFLKRGLSGK